jgi:hypothetical protein
MLSSLSQIDVLSLLEDAFALGNSGEISITNYLNLASQLKFELSFTLFSAILDNISFLISLHGEQAYFEQLKSFLSQIVSSCLLKYKVSSIPDYSLLIFERISTSIELGKMKVNLFLKVGPSLPLLFLETMNRSSESSLI